MSVKIVHFTDSTQPEPRYAVTGAFCRRWSDNAERRHSARGRNAGLQPAFLPVQLNNRIPSHVTGALSP